MGKRDSKEVVKGLRESVELIQKYLAERRNERGKDNPGNFEEVLLNGVMKANGGISHISREDGGYRLYKQSRVDNDRGNLHYTHNYALADLQATDNLNPSLSGSAFHF